MVEEPHKEVACQEPLLLTLVQVSKSLNLSRTTLYRLIEEEGLPILRFGRSVRVNPVRLRAWLEQREQIFS